MNVGSMEWAVTIAEAAVAEAISVAAAPVLGGTANLTSLVGEFWHGRGVDHGLLLVGGDVLWQRYPGKAILLGAFQALLDIRC